MGSKCSRGVANNVREELWSYFALSGLLFLHMGIVLMVFAVKEATAHPVAMEVFGTCLMVMGIMATLTSWYVHRQHRQKKKACVCKLRWCIPRCCNDKSHDQDHIIPPKKNKVAESDSVTAKTKHHQNIPSHTLKLFSTPEFQRYAEFTERDTAGVEQNGIVKAIGRSKSDTPRRKKHVHPQSPQHPVHITAAAGTPGDFTNPKFVHKGHAIPAPVTMTSPIFLKLPDQKSSFT